MFCANHLESKAGIKFQGDDDEGSVPEIAQYGQNYHPLNVFTASKGSSFYISFTSFRFFDRKLPDFGKNKGENPIFTHSKYKF